MIKIHELLKKDSQLSVILKRAKALESLNKHILDDLDPALRDACRIGDYKEGVLTLFTDNPGNATRLRYTTPTLLSSLRKLPAWSGLRSIQVKVQQWQPVKEESTPSIEENPPLPKPTASNQEAFKALAESLKGETRNQALVKALEKLASLAD